MYEAKICFNGTAACCVLLSLDLYGGMWFFLRSSPLIWQSLPVPKESLEKVFNFGYLCWIVLHQIAPWPVQEILEWNMMTESQFIPDQVVLFGTQTNWTTDRNCRPLLLWSNNGILFKRKMSSYVERERDGDGERCEWGKHPAYNMNANLCKLREPPNSKFFLMPQNAVQPFAVQGLRNVAHYHSQSRINIYRSTA